MFLLHRYGELENVHVSQQVLLDGVVGVARWGVLHRMESLPSTDVHHISKHHPCLERDQTVPSASQSGDLDKAVSEQLESKVVRNSLQSPAE